MNTNKPKFRDENHNGSEADMEELSEINPSSNDTESTDIEALMKVIPITQTVSRLVNVTH
jgi:hypothetical protein